MKKIHLQLGKPSSKPPPMVHHCLATVSHVVEIYTENPDRCIFYVDGVFNYIGATTNAAGLYLDNVGIVVCGGLKLGEPENVCYNCYQPVPDLLRWTKLEYEVAKYKNKCLHIGSTKIIILSAHSRELISSYQNQIKDIGLISKL